MIELLDVIDIKIILKDRKLLTVSENTGLAYVTLRNLQTGKTKCPTIDTIRILTNYFNKDKLRFKVKSKKQNGKS